MAEIRSTIDLMMERTAGMGLSDEEKKSLHREELEKRAKGIRVRLVETPEGAEKILGDLEDLPHKDRSFVLNRAWNELVDDLSVDSALSKQVEALTKLPPASERASELDELRSALKSSAKEQSKDKQKILTREKKRLSAFGISGSAVIPKITDELLAEGAFADKLEEFKGRLRIDET